MDDKIVAQIYFLRELCLEESGLIPAALEDMQQAEQDLAITRSMC